MPCDTKPRTPVQQQRQADAVKRLEQALLDRSVTIVIGANGAVAFNGWTDREGLADLCAYRRLLASNSPGLRQALARAEVLAGRTIDRQQIMAGVHSHDGGATWHKGH